MFFLLAPVPDGMNPAAMKATAVSVLMAIFWVTEAVSIFATAFIPVAAFPLLGVLNSKQIADSYGHHIVLLILGAFFVAAYPGVRASPLPLNTEPRCMPEFGLKGP